MDCLLSSKLFQFPRNRNFLLKTQAFSTFCAENPFYRKSFLHIFQECSKVKALEPGKQAHARMIVSGFKPNVFYANCLLQMYVKCFRSECACKVFDRMPERDCVSLNAMISGYSNNGKMGLAQSLFDSMPMRNVISWTSLISGYLQNGNCLNSVEVFVKMGRDGMAYDETTLSVVLKAIGSLENCILGVQVHGVAVKLGVDYDMFTGNAMLSMYAKCRMMDESLRFFNAMPLKDFVSWSAIIAASAQNDRLEDGLELFKKMLREGVGVSRSVYASVFKSCAGLSDSRLGLQLHGHALKSDFGANTTVGTAVLDMYVKCDDLLSATKVFNLLPYHDLQSYTALIVGYARCDHVFEAIELFLELLKSGFGCDEKSLSATFSACAVSNRLVLGTQIHGLAIKTPFLDNISVANAILDMYRKCGALPEAFHIFDEIKGRDIISWTSMLCAYAAHGYGNETLQVFEKMVLEKVMPNHQTFTGVLHACAHSGLVDEALHYFYTMKSKYGLEPQLEQYSCMVDAFGRCGRIIDALKLIQDMPLKANDVIWTSLLSNCRKQRNVEVAEIAATCLLKSNPQDSNAYVLLSQIYADAGNWDKASKLSRMMTSIGLKNKPCYSRIEVFSL